MALTPTPEHPTPEFWERVLREAQSRAREAQLRPSQALVDVSIPETIQEARIWESAEGYGDAVRDLVYTKLINSVRGIEAAPTSRAFVRSHTAWSPERVLRVLVTARELLGHEEVPTLDFLLGPGGQRWLAHHDGKVRRESDDEIAFDPSSPATVDGRISREEVWRIFANRLAAVRDVLPGLATEPNKHRKDQIDAIKKLAPALRTVARTTRRAFPLATWDIAVLEVMAKELSPDVDALFRSFERQEKPPKGVAARKVVTQGLAEDFKRLTGRPATGRGVAEESLFNCYAVAFCRELGHEFAEATIGDRREKRVRKRKPNPRKGEGHS